MKRGTVLLGTVPRGTGRGVPARTVPKYQSCSEKETLRFAERFGKSLRPGMVVALAGPIGSGKTLFIKGLARGLGVKNRDEVKSPTFVLFHLYKGYFLLHHFDLYRLEEEKELDGIGFDEFIRDPRAISVVEWADRARGRIPGEAIWVEFKMTGPNSREIRIRVPRPSSSPRKSGGR